MLLFFVAVITAALNGQWLGPAATEVMEKDPKYKAFKRTFGKYHGMSMLCNLIGFLCTTSNLIYTALNLSTI
ncbi:hypothetical protein KUCAC02_007368 [Chaenocephalus aceratus]|uniref:Uncharacterized protein n=1 Tax=Chaenocephalus aceratus TaxID=36190 RepID=A0ACB9X6W3_CHAAC|nr:hypothetical protein KUCAC02_007368 [Chaenocephalus aceratus]